MKYICVKINMSQNMKYYKCTSKLRLWVKFCSDFFVVNDIELHQLNLGPFRSLNFLIENPFKKCVFFALLSNKWIIYS
jgi:hypothetical protein